MNVNVLAFMQHMKPYIEPGQSVLECGSKNINGTVRQVLPVTLGIDLDSGENVDRVLDICQLENEYGMYYFDHVVCCETLEHVFQWKEALENMWTVLKRGGIFGLTTVNKRKAYHGYPHDYWRFNISDFLKVYKGNEILNCIEIGFTVGIMVRKITEIINTDFDVQKIKQPLQEVKA